MRRLYLAFIRGLSTDTFSRVGVILVTTSVFSFFFMEMTRVIGFITNAYVGLVTYMLFPALFILGLILIPIGWKRYSKRTGKPLKGLLKSRFDEDDLRDSDVGSRLVRTVAFLTLLNVVILSAASVRMLHFMDSAKFCGTACHKVMNPEWTTYLQSPHARVKCVECHVGEGTKALIDAKLNGMWQVVSATFNLYERPIPTPVHNLRPARETCEKCHWPEKFHGNTVENIIHYDLDEANTPLYTTLMMKIGSGQEGLDEGSHWHVASKNEIRYATRDEKRLEMVWVDVRQEDGKFKRFTNKKIAYEGWNGEAHERTMDCVDCHNRATHIYEKPENALDMRIKTGQISRSLPYIKKRALGVILNNYPSKEAGLKAIDTHIRDFYGTEYPKIYRSKGREIDQAVETVQAVYARNIHIEMNIEWGSYPSHLGHRDGPGCFRCHNTDMIDEDGLSISMDCTLCHSILADNEDVPFKYLMPLGEEEGYTGREMHKYLQEEFQESSLE